MLIQAKVVLTKLQYGFRTKAEDTELDKILSSLKGKERTNFIREALYFYIRNKSVIEQVSKDIAEIKEMIKNQSINTNLNSSSVLQKADNNNKKKTNEEILKGLVNDFLNM